MAHAGLPGIIEHLRLAVGTRDAPGVSDAQLLARFADLRDEAAFELLVWRHARMVLGTCRRLLLDAHEAEDALQACFLALAQRAGSIRRRGSVGGWLHEVALRLALAARARRTKRAAQEQTLANRAPERTAADPAREVEQRETYLVLDEEVRQLPDKFREPFVLCCLEGRSNAEAARELGCPLGTVESRLGRARQRLRERLSRRGLALPAGLLAALAGEGFVSASLVAATASAATLQSASQAVAAGLISTTVATLTEEVLRAMLMTKLKAVSVVLLAVTLAGAGAGALAYHDAPDGPPVGRVTAKDDAKIAQLIEQLGSDQFAEREKASKELGELGLAALDALRKAAKSDDLERRKRAMDLLAKIEVQATTAEVLTPKRLRLVYDKTPLAEAVADFKKKSGYDIALYDPEGKLKGRTVTLDTGTVTFWQALGQFCEKAQLVETSAPTTRRAPAQLGMGMPGMGGMGGMGGAAALPAPMPGGGARPGGPGAAAPPAGMPPMRKAAGGPGAAGGAAPPAAMPAAPGGAGGPGVGAPGKVGGGAGGAGGPAAPAAAPPMRVPAMPGGGAGGMGGGVAWTTTTSFSAGASPVQILLTDGKPRALPTDDTTSVRFRALDKADAKGKPASGDVLLALEVSLEPKLRWQQLVEVKVAKAIDAEGQKLAQVALPQPPNAPIVAAGRFVAVPAAPGGGGGAAGAPAAGAPAAWRALGGRVAAALPTGEPSASGLVAAIQLAKAAKASTSLKELSGTVTARVLGEAKTLLTVNDVLDAGGKSVKGTEGGSVHVLSASKDTNGRHSLRMEVTLPGGAAVSVSSSGDRIVLGDGSGGDTAQYELTVTDADGNLLQPTGIQLTPRAGAKGSEIRLGFLTRPGQGAPAKLALAERKSVAVELPFKLRDVSLSAK